MRGNRFFRILIIVAIAAMSAFAPCLHSNARACSEMSGMSGTDSASSACCGSSSCHCGMKNQAPEVDLALAPTFAPSAQPQASMLQFSDAPVLSGPSAPAREGIPVKTSDKEKLYDSQSSQRI